MIVYMFPLVLPGIIAIWYILTIINRLDNRLFEYVGRINSKYLTDKTMESKYEKGRWYKIEQMPEFKLKFLSRDEITRYSERISGKLHTVGADWCDNYYNLIPIDLSEIQQFLPEGHPDKIKTDIIPEYVEYLLDKPWGSIPVTKGKVYTFYKIVDDIGDTTSLNKNFSMWTREFKPSTKEAYEAQFKPKEPELIEGNWYECILNWSNWGKMLIKYVKISGDNYTVSKYRTKTGNSLRESEFQIKELSDIKPANLEEVYKYFPEERPKLTGKTEQPMNTYGLKVGDLISNNKILQQWCEKDKNSALKDGEWSLKRDVFSVPHERKIEEFFIYKDIIAFKLSNTNSDFYIKAEGFKEFMDNFDKPEDITPLSKFEISNKVKCTGKGEVCCSAYRLGSKAIDHHIIVVEKNPTIINKKFNKGEWWYRFTDEGNWYTEDSLELLETMKKELTSLPEKWYCIYSSKEEFDILNKHFNGGWGYSPPNGFNGARSERRNHWTSRGDNLAGFTEITFEQFKKWVLGANSTETKPKFEVEKWYKFKAFNIKRPYYAKVKLITSDGFNAVGFIPYTNSSPSYCVGGGFDNIVECSLLTDLSEIQSYLPDDHPDKIINKSQLYPINTEVRIKSSSSYREQGEVKGTKLKGIIITVNDRTPYNESNHHYRVRWSNNNENTYRPCDLELWEEEKKYNYEVVHCSTQEEWDFVAKTIRRTSFVGFKQLSSKNDTINLKDPNNSDNIPYWKSCNSKIYSFSEWCEKFGHKPEVKKPSLVGRWFKALEDDIQNSATEKGKYYQITREENNNIYFSVRSFIDIGIHESFRHKYELMPEGFIPPEKEMTPDEILEECKKRYPIGTIVKCPNGNTAKATVEYYDDRHLKDTKGSLYLGVFTNNNAWLYNKNVGWAEIVYKANEYVWDVQPKTNKNKKTIVGKKKGFDEKEHLSKSYNKKLEIKIKKQTKNKLKLQLS